MSYIPGEDAEELRSVVRELLDTVSHEADVRSLMESDSGMDEDAWHQAAAMGLHGLNVAEDAGGSGGTPIELGVVFEEMGARLFGGPFFSTVALAAPVLQELCATTELKAIAAGDLTATLVWNGPTPAESTLEATRNRDGSWAITGTAAIVVSGAAADTLVVAARTGAATGAFLVKGEASGVKRIPLTALDQTRRLAELRFASAPALALATDAERALRRGFDLATLYLAAEQLGGARAAMDAAVEYARTRMQFGRPIGSFQAIKHKCADMLIDVESARSVVYHGLWTAANDAESLSASAALARCVASDTYQRAAAENIQIHGGIGFTWEHSAHLYLKRAKSSQLLLGRPHAAQARLANAVGICGLPPQAATPLPADSTQNGSLSEIDAAVAAFREDHPVASGEDIAGDRNFREALFDAGLAMVTFAPGHGGRALDSSLQARVNELLAHAGAPDHTARNVIGLGMAMPTIHAHGSDALKNRHLRPCFSGEHIWCQLFSEPGAGSDLAGLATRAERDGDHFVINGQKVWTSLGHVADYGILLARTDPEVPKHRGLTFFVLDMTSPGVEVRPLRQLTGESEFNEVYLTDVRIPADNVVGEIGQGWKVALTTLANERASLGGHQTQRGGGPIGQAVQTYRLALARGEATSHDFDRLVTLWARSEAARLTNVRAAAQIGRQPGPQGSIAKLQMAELNKAIYELCVDLSGDAGLLIDDYDDVAPDFAAVHGGSDVRKAYLRSLANSIEGGTSEIMRNILGEHVLGLPQEPRLDRDIPWKETARS